MEDKIKIKMKLLSITEDGVDSMELWDKVNQIIFVLNELGITIYEDDKEAMLKWKHFLEANK
jgi:hypothetical protein